MRGVIAVILDLVISFVGAGLLVGWLTGGLTETGFNLQGWPALLVFALMIGYFVIGHRVLGFTIGSVLAGVRR